MASSAKVVTSSTKGIKKGMRKKQINGSIGIDGPFFVLIIAFLLMPDRISNT